MKRIKIIKFLLVIFAILVAAAAISFVLSSENALLTNPKGIIAQGELDLTVTNILFMLIVIVPTLFAILVVAWKYHEKNIKATFDPDRTSGIFEELLLWIIPSIIVAFMIGVTWKATHKLDPFQPIKSEVKPLTIQVIGLDWKWLFIYPELGIATVNFVQFPVLTPLNFKLASDGSPLNSFWLPQLSGQIYAMTGMVTQLHMMADETGEFAGRASEINGEGYASMTFTAKSTSQSDFDDWVASVQQSPLQLTAPIYNELAKPSQDNPIALYSHVEKNLFDEIIMKYMHHPE